MPETTAGCTAGYRLWAYATPEDSPYLYDQVEMMRQEWDAPAQACPWQLDPLMNVCDLWWRPVEDPPHA